MTFYQLFLPLATLFYFLIVFVLRSMVLWNQTGLNPFVFGNTDKAHDYIGRDGSRNMDIDRNVLIPTKLLPLFNACDLVRL